MKPLVLQVLLLTEKAFTSSFNKIWIVYILVGV